MFSVNTSGVAYPDSRLTVQPQAPNSRLTDVPAESHPLSVLLDAENAMESDGTFSTEVPCPARAIRRESGAMYCREVWVVALLRCIHTEVQELEWW